MLAATLLNHAGAAWIGEFISRWMDPKVMTWLVAGAFIAMAAWILVPDKMDDEESSLDKYGPSWPPSCSSSSPRSVTRPR